MWKKVPKAYVVCQECSKDPETKGTSWVHIDRLAFPDCRNCLKPYPCAPGQAKPPPWRDGKDCPDGARKGRELHPDFAIIQLKQQWTKEMGLSLAKLGLSQEQYGAVFGCIPGVDEAQPAPVPIPPGQDGDKEFQAKVSAAKQDTHQLRAKHEAALKRVEKTTKELEEAQENVDDSHTKLEDSERYMLLFTMAAQRQAHRVQQLGAKGAPSMGTGAASTDMEADHETAHYQHLNEQAMELEREVNLILDNPPPEGVDDPMEAFNTFNEKVAKAMGAFDKAREAKVRVKGKTKGTRAEPGPKKPKTAGDDTPDSGGALSSEASGAAILAANAAGGLQKP